MRRIGFGIIVVTMAGCSGASDQLATLRPNIGKIACNATNGAYVGRIVDVTVYSAAGQSATPVYVVERDGRQRNVPPGNTVVAADRCSDGQPATQAEAVPQPSLPLPSLTVDPALAKVGTEFSRRLVAFQGELQELQTRSGSITVKWSSKRCDMIEGEVIDFLLSLNRGHSGKVSENIEAERTCDGSTRMFRTTGDQFEQYRTGRINDVEILRGLR